MIHVQHLRHLVTTLAGILLCCTSTLACSAFRAPMTPPDKGGPPWIELASAHFVLKTDLDRHTARNIVTELERSHAALAHALRRPPRERETTVEVVVFERAIDFLEATPRSSAGAYFSAHLPGDLEPQPIIVMHDSELAEETRMTVQHELSHRFLHERFASLPRWLDEGLAEYYASARVANGRLILGAATSIDFSERPYVWEAWKDGFRQEQVPLHMAPTLRQLVEADREEFYPTGDDGPSHKQLERQAGLYAGAWRLVHLLSNGPVAAYRDRFRAFLEDLQRGARPRDAFLERYGADWKGLEEAYRDYLKVEQLQLVVAAEPPPSPAITPIEREIPARDVHLLWARLIPWRKDNLPRVQKELDAALAIDRDASEVLLRRVMLALRQKDLDQAKRDLDAVLAKAPNDPRALFGQILWHDVRARTAGGSSASSEGEALATAVERLSRCATSAAQLDVVAWYYLTHGRAGDALAFSTRARRADALCWGCEDTYAMILLQEGKLDEALAASDRALALAPERTSIAGLLAHRQQIVKARAGRGSSQR